MSRSHTCEACDRLEQNTPSFVLNGVTQADCASLIKNNGLANQLTLTLDNCATLQDLVDCLVGRHGEILPAYQLCEIQDWLADLTGNLHQLMSVWVCNECGQWNAIIDLQNRVANLEMRVENLENRVEQLENANANSQRVLNTILDHLVGIGVWSRSANSPTTPINITGSWQGDRRLAGGNINLFGTDNEADRFIRTNQTANNQNDIMGGL